VNNVRSETSHLRFGATMRATAAAVAACSAATSHQSKHCQEVLSHNPSVAKRTVIGSFFDQQHLQQVNKCIELGQSSDGIDRNGRMEHEQHDEEATGEDEQAQAAKASKVVTPQEQLVSPNDKWIGTAT
jgi:hypothetical protein